MHVEGSRRGRGQQSSHQPPMRSATQRAVCWLFRVVSQHLANGILKMAICFTCTDDVGQARNPARLFTFFQVFHEILCRGFAGGGLIIAPRASRRVAQGPPRLLHARPFNTYCIPRNPQRTVLAIGPASLSPRLSNEVVRVYCAPGYRVTACERTDGDPEESPAINGAE